MFFDNYSFSEPIEIQKDAIASLNGLFAVCVYVESGGLPKYGKYYFQPIYFGHTSEKHIVYKNDLSTHKICPCWQKMAERYSNKLYISLYPLENKTVQQMNRIRDKLARRHCSDCNRFRP